MFFRGQSLGKYRILAPLGSGGFGTVYLAEDTWIDKKVAVKVPHRQNLDFGELLREPRLLASVSHPNIVSITTAEKQDNLFFIVMEYVRATRWRTSSASKARSISRARSITRSRSATRSIMRTAGRHPSRPASVNVLVSDQAVCKVVDFGTSRFLEIAAHGTTVIGSPPYMAPEQFRGKTVFASDLYSLGVTMYQMLTGQLPYDPPAPSDVDRLFSGELVSPPRLKNPAISQAAQRHRPQGDGPGPDRALQRAADVLEDLFSLRSEVRRRATPPGALAGRPAAGRPPTTVSSRWPGGRPGQIENRLSDVSAGTAASPCTPAPTGAPSAAKSSSGTPGPSASDRRTFHQLPRPVAPTGMVDFSLRFSVTEERRHGIHGGTGQIWMNGKLVAWPEAKIHVASHVIHYGSAVFEGARCYSTPKGSACFRLDDHMRRLYDSARIYRMDYDAPATTAGGACSRRFAPTS